MLRLNVAFGYVGDPKRSCNGIQNLVRPAFKGDLLNLAFEYHARNGCAEGDDFVDAVFIGGALVSATLYFVEIFRLISADTARVLHFHSCTPVMSGV